MNRFIRTGLAIATMPGGMLLLGQAAASADTVGTSRTAARATTGDTDGGDGTAVNSGNEADPDNQSGDIFSPAGALAGDELGPVTTP
ncbi:MAG: hypothetical protein JWP68_3694 [Modestobacter sp.]|jgi:hypothetical protein|nr:hypothetical protein [Modestobacter sp.]